jgi:hypothetical protein
MNTSAETSTCGCDGCRTGGLPANPFLAPRVAHGMLLGEDDFATITGYPRGKHMLHQAWCHGPGVIWGYRVHATGTFDLCIGPGLALDAHGRELLHETTQNLDLRELRDVAVREGKLVKPEKGCDSARLEAWLVADFTGCRTAPVPTLADPCDVTRSHDDYSRVAERARMHLVLERPSRPPSRYHRVRVLLGLDTVADGDDAAGEEALAAREAVLAAADLTQALERQLREMACRDAMDLCPAMVDDNVHGWFPVLEEDSAVLLAHVVVKLAYVDGCWEFNDPPCVHPCVRATLLPTDLITSLAAGQAPALLGSGAPSALSGPRVDADNVVIEDGGRRLVLPVTAELVPGTVPGAVQVSTLDSNGSDCWDVEEIYHTAYDGARRAIVVRLDDSLRDRPAPALVRVQVRGTGGKPVMGRDPLLPLAGVLGRPPGDPKEGRDAVWCFVNDPGDESGDETVNETAEGRAHHEG